LLDKKYFDVAQDRFFLPEESCTLAEWLSSSGQAKFAIHPKGFPVFLDPIRLSERDEYRDSDPYDVVGSGGELSWHLSMCFVPARRGQEY
jgi:hypothetical protein